MLARTSRALLVLVVLCVACVAQESQAPAEPEEFPTKLEELLEKTGAVVVKGTTPVGSVAGLRGTAYITSWEILDVRAGRREYGISIEIRENAAQSERERERERGDVAYVDYDELDPLISGLDHLLKLDNTATRLSTFEAQYRTNGYLSIFRFNTTGGYGTAVSAAGRRGNRLILRPTGLVEFRDMIRSAKAVIDEARQRQ